MCPSNNFPSSTRLDNSLVYFGDDGALKEPRVSSGSSRSHRVPIVVQGQQQQQPDDQMIMTMMMMLPPPQFCPPRYFHNSKDDVPYHGAEEVNVAVRKIIFSTEEGAMVPMSANLMMIKLVEGGMREGMALKLPSQIRKGAPLHYTWKAAFSTGRFFQRTGRSKEGGQQDGLGSRTVSSETYVRSSSSDDDEEGGNSNLQHPQKKMKASPTLSSCSSTTSDCSMTTEEDAAGSSSSGVIRFANHDDDIPDDDNRFTIIDCNVPSPVVVGKSPTMMGCNNAKSLEGLLSASSSLSSSSSVVGASSLSRGGRSSLSAAQLIYSNNPMYSFSSDGWDTTSSHGLFKKGNNSSSKKKHARRSDDTSSSSTSGYAPSYDMMPSPSSSSQLLLQREVSPHCNSGIIIRRNMLDPTTATSSCMNTAAREPVDDHNIHDAQTSHV
jgi:hypothetical protein